MRVLGIVVLCLAALGVALSLGSRVLNAGVARELREDPDGERARKVMLLTLPSGKRIPVNYLREGQTVYAGADFPWWRELRDAGAAVTVWIRGDTLQGHGRAVEDDAERRATVFAKLRPTAPSFTGTLQRVELEATGDDTAPAVDPRP